MKTKEFDCVQMKNTIQEKMFEEIKNLHGSQLIDYYKKKLAESSFAHWWQSGIKTREKTG